jgi:hypothetical protein
MYMFVLIHIIDVYVERIDLCICGWTATNVCVILIQLYYTRVLISIYAIKNLKVYLLYIIPGNFTPGQHASKGMRQIPHTYLI